MKKYIMDRGSGKTTKMIEFAGVTDGVLIVHSDAAKRNAEARAKELGYENLMIVSARSINTVLDGLKGLDQHKLDNVFVDEAAFVLSALLPACNVRAVTLSEVD